MLRKTILDLIRNKLKSLIYVCTGASGIFAGLCYMKEDEAFYDNILLPVVHKLDAETAHKCAVIVNKFGLVPKSSYSDPPVLQTKLWDLEFKNPIGMAAGFDKHGEAVEGLHRVGFGFVEIGSVTPEPQEGNEKPRVFRLTENKAIINRYGFNSEGHTKVLERVKKLKENGFNGIIGVNLGKNKNSLNPIQDYVEGIKNFGPVADYLVINVSSPNTPGLRDWQEKNNLEILLTELIKTRDSLDLDRKPPLLLKLAPDLTNEQRNDVAKLILNKKCRVDGLIIANTSITRAELVGTHSQEIGGLSGKPLSDLSTQMIAQMRELTRGEIPIIGVGGVFSGQDAYEKILAGASLVQLYTAFAFHGPPRITRIKKELANILNSSELSLDETVGQKSKQFSSLH